MKFLGLPFLILMSAWAGHARAADLEDLPLGAPLSSVQQAAAAQGLSLLPAGGSGADRAVYLVPRANPAQLEFCGGALVRVTQALPGGIAAFLARSEAETRRRGLAVPHLEALGDGGEIAYGEWHLPDGMTVTVAWTADRDGAIASITRDRPCRDPGIVPGGPLPAPVAAAMPEPPVAPAPPAPVPSPAPASPPAQARSPAAALASSASAAADVRVPLPEAPADLAVNALRPGPAKAPPPGKSRPEPARPEQARPEPSRPEAPRSVASQPGTPPAGAAGATQAPKPSGDAVVTVPLPPEAARNAAADASDPNAVPTSTVRRAPVPRPVKVVRPPAPRAVDRRAVPPPPAGIRPVPPAGEAEAPAGPPADPGTTNAIGPAAPLDLTLEGGEPGLAPSRAPPPPAADRRAGWRPSSPAECAKAFRSYDPRTGRYRTMAGQILPCP